MESIYWCCLTNCKAGDSKADVAFQSSCEQGDRLWFMLKCVASKRRTRLLNKLNKSSAIHPGLGGSPAHVDQRRTAAACNITQWRRGPTGGKQHREANTEHCSHRKELCTNAAATPAQNPSPPPPPHYPPGASSTQGEWRGVGSTLRLDILSVDGTIIWEEIEELVEDTGPMSTYWCNFSKHG